jgi:hypothetical protein
MNIYSYKDVSLAFVHPLVDSFFLTGEEGAGQIVISNTTDHTVHSVAADGTTMVSAVAGENGHLTLEVQQTSSLQKTLLTWFNAVNTALKGGDVSNWATAVVVVRSLLDGSVHTLTGVSPLKNPDKTYAAQGGNITWTLMAAKVISE